MATARCQRDDLTDNVQRQFYVIYQRALLALRNAIRQEGRQEILHLLMTKATVAQVSRKKI